MKFKNLKRFLMVNCLLIDLTYPSGLPPAESPELETLQDEIKITEQRVRNCREAYGEKNSIIVIGRTGRGKSTLITHLANVPLMAKLDDAGFTLDTRSPLPDFHIGKGVAVGTRVPTSWYDSISDSVYWDCPGFGDPRGADTEIINSFSIQQLFQAPSRIKIVIAVQDSDLHIRAENFGSVLRQVIETFPDNSQLERCLSLVITRQRDIVDIKAVLERIHTTAEASEFFSAPRVKSLIKFLKDNAETRVSCMPVCCRSGILCREP